MGFIAVLQLPDGCLLQLSCFTVYKTLSKFCELLLGSGRSRDLSASDLCARIRGVCSNRVSLRCLCAIFLFDAFSIAVGFALIYQASLAAVIVFRCFLVCYANCSSTVSSLHRVMVGAANLLMEQLFRSSIGLVQLFRDPSNRI